jgi:hypothetical protein
MHRASTSASTGQRGCHGTGVPIIDPPSWSTWARQRCACTPPTHHHAAPHPTNVVARGPLCHAMLRLRRDPGQPAFRWPHQHDHCQWGTRPACRRRRLPCGVVPQAPAPPGRARRDQASVPPPGSSALIRPVSTGLPTPLPGPRPYAGRHCFSCINGGCGSAGEARGRHAGVVFVADDLAEWLIGLLADAAVEADQPGAWQRAGAGAACGCHGRGPAHRGRAAPAIRSELNS